MKRLWLLLVAVLIFTLWVAVRHSWAGTVTVTTAGFANLPASAPANWPPAVAYPAGASITGTHSYTVNDADMLRIMTWTAVTQSVGPAPSALQILLAWVQYWWTSTAVQEQGFSTPAPVKPPPINVQ